VLESKRFRGRDAVVEARWNDEGEVDVAEVED